MKILLKPYSIFFCCIVWLLAGWLQGQDTTSIFLSISYSKAKGVPDLSPQMQELSNLLKSEKIVESGCRILGREQKKISSDPKFWNDWYKAKLPDVMRGELKQDPAVQYLLIGYIGYASSTGYSLTYRIIPANAGEKDELFARQNSKNWAELKTKWVAWAKKTQFAQKMGKTKVTTTPPKTPTTPTTTTPPPVEPPPIPVIELGWFGENMPLGMKRHTIPGEYFVSKDQSIVVYVPAGAYQHLSSETTDEYVAQELPAFYIDKYEITNQQFCMFLNETKTSPSDSAELITLDSEECGIALENGKYFVKPGAEIYPVVQISWYGAQKYTEWAGKKLPTEFQWEKASRGGIEIPQWKLANQTFAFISNPAPQRKYPWDQEAEPFARTNSQTDQDGYVGLCPVDAFAGLGDSPYQCCQMVGNVWEWCDTSAPSELKPCLGGSWATEDDLIQCSSKQWANPKAHSSDLGFRGIILLTK